MVQASTHILPPLRTDWDSGPGLLLIRIDHYFALLKQPMFFILMWIFPSVLFALWVVVVLQDSSHDFPLCGLDNQWWQCVLWSSAAAFVVLSSKPTFLDQHLGETLVYFLQLFFLFLAFIPNILLLKLFHKLLPAKMYLSGRCEILSEHGGHKAHSLD